LQTYRAYLLNDQGRITWGDWIEAIDETEALAKAKALCSEGTPNIEVWQGARKLAEDRCEGAERQVRRPHRSLFGFWRR
jgi:hypothetical protein